MDQKFASFTQNKKLSSNKLNQQLNLKKVSPDSFNNSQAKYDTISVIYAKEIDCIAKFLSSINTVYFFSKEKFSKNLEDLKEKFKKFNININFYQVKNLDEIVNNISNFNCGVIFFDVLNDNDDMYFLSNFLDSKNIQAINFSNCNTVLSSKLSIDVDLKKNILKSLSSQEKLKVILDCVYLSLQAKRAIDLKFIAKL